MNFFGNRLENGWGSENAMLIQSDLLAPAQVDVPDVHGGGAISSKGASRTFVVCKFSFTIFAFVDYVQNCLNQHQLTLLALVSLQ